MPKHYRSPSQTKTFFSTLSERTLCCCCLLPKFLNEGRGLVESAFFLFLFFFIHFPCSYLGNMFPLSIWIWIWFILQRHLRQDSGIGRLRLRQILLLRSTEYVFKIHSKASCMPPLEFHGACPFYLVLLSRFNETQFKGKWGSHINVLVCLFLGKP